MNSPWFNLLVFAGFLALVSIFSVAIFRSYIRSLGMEKMMAEGVLLGETGIEFPAFMLRGIARIKYDEIESVKLVHFPATLTLRMYQGKVVNSRIGPGWGEFFSDVVVIKLKPPCFIQYEAFKPKNPIEFYNALKARIDRQTEVGALSSSTM